MFNEQMNAGSLESHMTTGGTGLMSAGDYPYGSSGGGGNNLQNCYPYGYYQTPTYYYPYYIPSYPPFSVMMVGDRIMKIRNSDGKCWELRHGDWEEIGDKE